MSDSHDRNTQFAGFADMVTDEIMQLDGMGFDENDPDIDTKIAAIIASRAYDFLVSSHYHTAMLDSWEESKQRVALVPDMTEWPDWIKR